LPINIENFKKAYLLDDQGLHLFLEPQPPPTVTDVEDASQPLPIVNVAETISQPSDEMSTDTPRSHVIKAIEVLTAFFTEHPELTKETTTITVPSSKISLEDAIQTIQAIQRDHPELTTEQQKNFAAKVMERVGREE